MIRHINFSIILLACFSLSLLNAGIITPVFAVQENTKEAQQNDLGKIYGKVTDVINAAGYTYAEVDTGKEKVWAAGPVTQLKMGDIISFSSQMPMQNFHSKSLGRNFPVLYFINRFITDKQTATTAALPHDQIKQQQTGKVIKGIKKLKVVILSPKSIVIKKS